LLLDGRGSTGAGCRFEVIDLPCVVGSGRNCQVWVNSPQIETRHLQITEGDQVGARGISQRSTAPSSASAGSSGARSPDGDEYRLAGYLRLRTELR